MLDFFRDPMAWIDEWIRGLLIDGIISSFEETFSAFSHEVEQISENIGHTPQSFNPNIFNMVRGLSETVIVPIAGVILAFVVSYELITMIMEKNNMHDFDTWIFMKWIIKTFIAINLVTNAFGIVNLIFTLAQTAVQGSAAYLGAEVTLNVDLVELETVLWDMGMGQLINLQLQMGLLSLAIRIMGIMVFILINARMLEIYILTSIGPIPLSLITNKDYGSIGHSWIKSLAALAFQAFLIMVCVAIYGAIISSVDVTAGIGFMWTTVAYTILLIMMLWKTGSISKSVFGV